MRRSQRGRRPIAPPRIRSRVGRWVQLGAGLAIFAIATALMIQSGLGLGPWDALHTGVHRVTGISIGVASVAVGLAIIVGTTLFGVRPGPGTIANMVLIGLILDWVLPVIPPVSGLAPALVYHALGITLVGLATGMYLGARLGAGPRDGLMNVLVERRGWSIRRTRTLVEISALALGLVLGGTLGVGTVLFLLTVGPAAQWGMRLFGVLPRDSEPTAAVAALREGSDTPPQFGMPARLRRLSFVAVVCLLAVLLLIPVWIWRRTGVLHDRVTEVIMPARNALLEGQLAFASEVASMRGFEITGDTLFLQQFREDLARDRAASERLTALARRIGPQAVAPAEEFQTRKDAWREQPLALLEGRASREQLVGTLSIGQSRLEAAFAAADEVNTAVIREEAEVRERIRSEELVAWILVALLALAALAGALVVASLSRRLDTHAGITP